MSALQQQLRHDADAQTLLHHGDDSVVILGVKAYVGLHARRLQGPSGVVVGAFQQADKGLCLALHQGEAGVALKAAVPGQNGQQPVLHQGDALTVHGAGHVDKANVNAAFHEPLLHVMIVPVEQFELHPGIVLLELLQHRRQPVHCHRSEAADAHGAALQPPDGGGGLGQLLRAVEEVPHRRDQPLPLAGEPHPGPAPLQQGEAQLLLQTFNAVADGGLGAAQALGRPGQAAILHHRHQSLIFADVHDQTALL